MEAFFSALWTFAGIGLVLVLHQVLVRKGYLKTPADKTKYYAIRRYFDRFRVCDSFAAFTTQATKLYYLRKGPFNVEVTAENILGADGLLHNAVANVKVCLPPENVIKTAEKYFTRGFKHTYDEEIDTELSVFMSEGLERILESYSGTETDDELKTAFKAEALPLALAAHHLVTEVSSIRII